MAGVAKNLASFSLLRLQLIQRIIQMKFNEIKYRICRMASIIAVLWLIIGFVDLSSHGYELTNFFINIMQPVLFVLALNWLAYNKITLWIKDK